MALELTLPYTYIADRYSSRPNSASIRYPINIYQCRSCGHVQSLDIVDLEILFNTDYTYKPSNNQSLLKHFDYYASILQNKLDFKPSKCMDIGSNDGLYLSVLRDMYQCKVLGVDPASAPVQAAAERGIRCIQEFFTLDIAKRIRDSGETMDYVSANNVFAHNDELSEFTAGVSHVLSNQGIFSFECSYLVDIVDKALMGTIFHEHLSHHSLSSLIPFLKRFDLNLFHAERVNTQGGAIIAFASKGKQREITSELSDLLEEENKKQVTDAKYMQLFRDNYTSLVRDFRTKLTLLSPKVNRVVAFGAARSANFLIEIFQLQDMLDVVIDDNPEKCGKYLYGSSIPIVGKSNFEFKDGDLVIPLAWIHSNSIKEQMKNIKANVAYLQFYPNVAVTYINNYNFFS